MKTSHRDGESEHRVNVFLTRNICVRVRNDGLRRHPIAGEIRGFFKWTRSFKRAICIGEVRPHAVNDRRDPVPKKRVTVGILGRKSGPQGKYG